MVGRIGQFVTEVQAEMGKVTWPTRDELTASTTIVLVVSFALSVFIYIVDSALSTMMNLLLF